MFKVLVVEDDDDRWVKTTLEGLRRENWVPTLRTDHDAALRDLERGHYDAFIMDMSLKERSSEGVNYLLESVRDKDLVFLAVHSGNADPELAVKAGAEALLRKPIAPGTLQDILESALIRRGTRLQLPSCFLSYAHQDEPFARKLRRDLEVRGVECWFAPEDLEIGALTRQAIHQAIARKERLLLILSKHSVTSDWVRDEVEHALDIERRKSRRVLFPIRLDEAVLQSDEDWPATVRATRNIGDFSAWQEESSYQKALRRLLRDLGRIDLV